MLCVVEVVMKRLFILFLLLPAHAYAIDFSKALEEFKVRSRQVLDTTTRAAGNAAVVVIDASEKAATNLQQINRNQTSSANTNACQTCGITDPAEIPERKQTQVSPAGIWADTRQHTVNNSRVQIFGRAPIDTTWVFVDIKHNKTGQTYTYYFTTNRGEFAYEIGLRYGPGEYQLRFAHQNTPQKYSSYTYFADKSVINNDENTSAFSLPSNEVQSDHPQMIALAQAITKNKTNDRDRSQAIHTWVTKNIAYDVETYFAGTYRTNYPTDAISVLKNGKSICQGYSSVIAALHRAIGIPAKIVTGITINITDSDENVNPIWESALKNKTYGEHAWNEVLIDGKWEVLDATWDSGYVNFETKQFKFKNPEKDGYKYLFPKLDSFSRDHRKLSETND
jgi:transglutaminase-like putative cysteine protease